jgi:hypothetical protein
MRLVQAPSYRDYVLGLSGLRGYWRLTETSGTVARDLTGRNDGAYQQSPSLGTEIGPRGGTAAKFNGIDQGVLISAAVTTVTTGWTLAAWVKPTATAGYKAVIYVGTGTANNGYGLYVDPSTRLVGFGKGVGDLYDTNTSSGTVLTTGVWQLLALTRSGTAYRGTINGIDARGTDTGANPIAPATNTGIGFEPANTNWSDSTIAEAIVVERALTDDELARMARLGRGF